MSHAQQGAPPAAGAVLWRPAERRHTSDAGSRAAPRRGSENTRQKENSANVEVAVVHRPRYDDWSFPKGKLEPDETALQAAVREVLEETGSTAAVQQHLTTVSYETREGPKSVDYWSMRHSSGSFRGRHETDALRWLPIDEAYERLTYDVDCAVLEQFETAEIPDCVVLLVRHVKAGKRSLWKGPDSLRPLENEGCIQAKNLVSFAQYFQPQYLATAPPLRCVQTLEPMANALKLPIKEAEWLGDEACLVDPYAAHKALLHRVRKGKTTVLCSQGDAIPLMLDQLGASGLVKDLTTAKGAAWVLCFRDERLVALDHYPAPSEA